MSSWLGMLPLELEEVKELAVLGQEAQEGETEVGEVSDNLRKIYTLSQGMKKQADFLAVEARYKQPTSEEKARISELVYKAAALDAIFKIGIHDELGIWGHEGKCGVRSGWKVVIIKNTPGFPFPFTILGPENDQQ